MESGKVLRNVQSRMLVRERFSVALLFASISTTAFLCISSTSDGSCLDTQSLLWILHASLPHASTLLYCIHLLLLASVPSRFCPLSLHSLFWLTFLLWLLGWPLVSIPSPYLSKSLCPVLVPGHTDLYMLTSHPHRRWFVSSSIPSCVIESQSSLCLSCFFVLSGCL